MARSAKSKSASKAETESKDSKKKPVKKAVKTKSSAKTVVKPKVEKTSSDTTTKHPVKPIKKASKVKKVAKKTTKKAAATTTTRTTAAKKAVVKKAVKTKESLKKNAQKKPIKSQAGSAPKKAAKKLSQIVGSALDSVTETVYNITGLSQSNQKRKSQKPGIELRSINVRRIPIKNEGDSRPKSFEKIDVSHNFGFRNDSPELPGKYGEDRLVLMAKDPESMFCYWEITPETLSGYNKNILGNNFQEALRVSWQPKDLFDQNFTFFPVQFTAGNWYFKVPAYANIYQVEIGWLNGDGQFISILQSNSIAKPESWSLSQQRLESSGNGAVKRSLKDAHNLGSSEQVNVESKKEGLFKNLLSSDFHVSSLTSSASSTSSQKKSSQNSSPKKEQPPQPVYEESPVTILVDGEVQSAKRVLVNKTEAQLNSKGSFRVEIPEPENGILEVEIISKNTGEKRTYNLGLQKKTTA